MEHEPTTTSPEKIEQSPENVFALEKLTPDQVAVLVRALGAAAEPGVFSSATIMMETLEADMTQLPNRAPDKADELFMALTTAEDAWTRAVATSSFARSLLRTYNDDLEKRRQVIDRWVKLLEDEDSFVRETARDTLSELLPVATWLDEPTAAYLDSKLPHGWRRNDW